MLSGRMAFTEAALTDLSGLTARGELAGLAQVGDEPREVGAVRALGEAERRALPRLPGDPARHLPAPGRPAHPGPDPAGDAVGPDGLHRGGADRAVRALGEAERRALPRLPGDPLAALGREPAAPGDRMAFTEAALTDLSGLTAGRVAGLLHDPRGSGMAPDSIARRIRPGVSWPAWRR
jgi:hypothetical protein